MGVPKRIKKYTGRHALVDTIPYEMPIAAKNSPSLMAGFSCDYEKAKKLLPGNELHPFRLLNGRAVFVVTVLDYRETNIGKYVEYSLAIACTHGLKPAPRMLPALLMKTYGFGQYILDLPVSSEVSVKGGKGIWGMPKHQANLDFLISEKTVSSQYEKDGQFCFRIELDRPKSPQLKMGMTAVNYCRYRNMLMASKVHSKFKVAVNLGKKASARLFIGDHPKVAYMKDLDINPKPFFTLYTDAATGILDDHLECWFMTYDKAPAKMPEGFESVFHLTRSEEWLAPPSITDFEQYRLK